MFKKTVIFIGLSLFIIFVGVGIEIIAYEHLLGTPITGPHSWGHLSLYAIMALIPVVYMVGVSNKKRIFIFLKSTLTLIVVYFTYFYLVHFVSVVIRPVLFSNLFSVFLFFMSLKGVMATLVGLYVSVQCMEFERKKASFALYPTEENGANNEVKSSGSLVKPCENAAKNYIAPFPTEEAEKETEVEAIEQKRKKVGPDTSGIFHEHSKKMNRRGIGWFRGVVVISNLWCLLMFSFLSFPHGTDFVFLNNTYEKLPSGGYLQLLSYDEAKALGLTVPKNRADYGKKSNQVDRKSETGKKFIVGKTPLVDLEEYHVLSNRERWEQGIDLIFVFCFFFCVSCIVLLFSPILKNDIYALLVKRKSLEYQRDIEVLIGQVKP